MTNDPISDLLTRIRNAQMRKHRVCEIPASNLKLRIVKLLKVEGFLKNYKLIRDDKQGLLKIALKYTEEGVPVIHELKRVSKPSLRKYIKADELGKNRNGLGAVIISTSRGVMTDRQATKENLGGEILFKIW